MRNLFKFIPALTLFLFCTACSHPLTEVDKAAATLGTLVNDLKLDSCSYLIGSTELNITEQRYAAQTTFDAAILQQFTYPVALKMLQNEGLLKGSFTFKNEGVRCRFDRLLAPDKTTLKRVGVSSALRQLYKNSIDSLLPRADMTRLFVDEFSTSDKSRGFASKALLTKSFQLAKYLQRPDISGFNTDTVVPNRYRGDYLNGIHTYLGWRIFTFNKQLVFWNCSEQNGHTVLIMHLINKGLFAGFTYPTNQLPSPITSHGYDLVQSPLAACFLRSIYAPGLQITSKVLTTKAKANIAREPYHFLISKEAKAVANAYRKSGQLVLADTIAKRHDTLFPNNISATTAPNNLVAAIDYMGDNANERRYFTLPNATTLQLFASGQVMTEIWGSDRVYGRDYINIVLRSIAQNRTLFRSKFYYKYPYINGSKVNKTPFPFAFKDLNDSSYYFEVSLDWNLNAIEQAHGEGIEIYVEAGDSDSKPRETESSLASSSQNTPFTFNKTRRNTSVNLGGAAKTPYADFIGESSASQRLPDSIVVDGTPEALWESTSWQGLPHLNGALEHPNDHSAKYKALWNGDKLYFLFQITDQAKQYAWLQSKDYCRIVDANSGHLMWQITGDRTGHFPFYVAHNRFKLPKGHYYLEYISNDRLSFANWCANTPPADFYGAYLYYVTDTLRH